MKEVSYCQFWLKNLYQIFLYNCNGDLNNDTDEID